MKIKNNKFFVSPSDLNNFVACKYTVLNEIKYHNKEIRKSPDRANDKLWTPPRSARRRRGASAHHAGGLRVPAPRAGPVRDRAGSGAV